MILSCEMDAQPSQSKEVFGDQLGLQASDACELHSKV